jgi:UDP-GlcNAc:undecaprenyl-phosphate/decaprenyl-phosphate GlcNAc-1-phosphate transferase
MYSLLWLAFSSFILSLVLTPLCRNAFRKLGIVDHPDGHRKLHVQPIPRAGGIPIAISVLAAYALLALSPLNGRSIITHGFPLAIRLLPAAALVLAIGLADDLIGLKARQKLLGQLVASGFAFWAGVRILGIAGHSTESWWSLPLTVIWLIGCTNAFNLLDGVDGLASGVGFFATLTMVVAAFLQNNVALALATVPLAGALLGFLRYNFNPASIFLGDGGSLLLGFLLGCYGVIWSQKSATLLGMTAPLIMLAIPLLDVCLSIIRRFLRHQPIFGADRGHIHHRLLDRGLTPRHVALLMYGVCGLFAASSLLQSVAPNRYSGVIVILFCAVTWIGVQNLGYVEIGVAGRMLLAGAFRRMLNDQLRLRNFEESLAAAQTVDDSWAIIRDSCKNLGFNEVRLQLKDEIYQDKVGDSALEPCWHLRIPLADLSYIDLTREFNSPVLPMIVAPFVDVLRSQLQLKLRQSEAELALPATFTQAAGMAAQGRN